MDNDKGSFAAEFGSSWGLVAGALLIGAPVIFMKVKDTTDIAEDLKFSDETPDEVIGHSVVAKNEGESPAY